MALGLFGSGTTTIRRSIGRESGLSQYLRNDVFRPQIGQLQDFANVFGIQDVEAGRQAQLDLATQLQQLSETGGLPSAADFQAGRGVASNLLAGERASLQNSLTRAQEQSNRQAAQMGRSGNDPILQAQLRRQQIESERELAGRETAIAQQVGSSLPMQRLNFQQQRAGVLQGVGSQASTMRSNLLGLGTNIQNMENQIRLGQGSTTQSQQPSFGQQIAGGLGLVGSGMSVYSGLSGLGAFGSATTPLGGTTAGANFYETAGWMK